MKLFSYLITIVIIMAIQTNLEAHEESLTLNNVSISWSFNENSTAFVVSSKLPNTVKLENSWLGIGFNSMRKMEGASIVVCRYSEKSKWVKHYVAKRYKLELIDKENESVGLSNAQVVLQDGLITCKFTRDDYNVLNRVNYYELIDSAFVLVAYGSGDPSYHGGNKEVTQELVSFYEIIPEDTTISTNIITGMSFNNSTTQSMNTKPVTYITNATSTIATSTNSKNLCYPNPCKNGSCIIIGPTLAKCECNSQFTGYLCEHLNPCASRPCQNDALCVPFILFNTLPQYKCSCFVGYFGKYCELNTQYDCSPDFCKNGGTCVKTNGLAKCICLPYFTGKRCENIYNPCFVVTNNMIESSPCYNSGQCLINYSQYPFYQCKCIQGYYGPNCEKIELTTTTRKYSNNQDCVDVNPVLCKYYAQNKYCSNLFLLNGIGILDYCPNSCNYCSESKVICSDSQTNCAIFALYKQCNKLNSLIPHPCRKSCNLCK